MLRRLTDGPSTDPSQPSAHRLSLPGTEGKGSLDASSRGRWDVTFAGKWQNHGSCRTSKSGPTCRLASGTGRGHLHAAPPPGRSFIRPFKPNPHLMGPHGTPRPSGSTWVPALPLGDPRPTTAADQSGHAILPSTDPRRHEPGEVPARMPATGTHCGATRLRATATVLLRGAR